MPRRGRGGRGHVSLVLRHAKGRAFTGYLKTVTLSKAKGLGVEKERFFASLRMTHI